jgi:hypothetical protein
MRTMFFDREYSPEDIRRHCGSMRQIAHVMSFELRDGREKGVHCLHFRTGSGLNFTAVPSRCMDIAFCDYKGINLVWQSPTTIAAPEFYEAEEMGWLRGFFGGLLTTCGLVNVGRPDQWNGERYGIHGRIGHTPASHISHDALWAGNDYYLLARGEMREGRPFGPNLVLRRRIQTQAGQRYFSIHDTVVNEGHQPAPLQLHQITPRLALRQPHPPGHRHRARRCAGVADDLANGPQQQAVVGVEGRLTLAHGQDLGAARLRSVEVAAVWGELPPWGWAYGRPAQPHTNVAVSIEQMGWCRYSLM